MCAFWTLSSLFSHYLLSLSSEKNKFPHGMQKNETLPSTQPQCTIFLGFYERHDAQRWEENMLSTRICVFHPLYMCVYVCMRRFSFIHRSPSFMLKSLFIPFCACVKCMLQIHPYCVFSIYKNAARGVLCVCPCVELHSLRSKMMSFFGMMDIGFYRSFPPNHPEQHIHPSTQTRTHPTFPSWLKICNGTQHSMNLAQRSEQWIVVRLFENPPRHPAITSSLAFCDSLFSLRIYSQYADCFVYLPHTFLPFCG